MRFVQSSRQLRRPVAALTCGALVLLAFVSGCKRGDVWIPNAALGDPPTADAEPFATYFKGFELYLFEQDGAPQFALLRGTDRDKQATEIFEAVDQARGGNVAVRLARGTGWTELRTQLMRLPEGSGIALFRVRRVDERPGWEAIHPAGPTVDQITRDCAVRDIQVFPVYP